MHISDQLVIFDKLIADKVLKLVSDTVSSDFCTGCPKVDVCEDNELYCMGLISKAVTGKGEQQYV